MNPVLCAQRDVNKQRWAEQSRKVPWGCHRENVAVPAAKPCEETQRSPGCPKNQALDIFRKPEWLSGITEGEDGSDIWKPQVVAMGGV